MQAFFSPPRSPLSSFNACYAGQSRSKVHFLLKQQTTSHVTFRQSYAAFMYLRCYSDSPSFASLPCATASFFSMQPAIKTQEKTFSKAVYCTFGGRPRFFAVRAGRMQTRQISPYLRCGKQFYRNIHLVNQNGRRRQLCCYQYIYFQYFASLYSGHL